jgi:D-sedoheptulose 7-phosphate isomerase
VNEMTTIHEELIAHIAAVRETVEQSEAVIESIVRSIYECFARGGKLLACGNGGSAADSQHFVAEFMNRFQLDRRPWPAIALTTDTSVLTSIGNDIGYDAVFARQVDALACRGDALIAMSTSGASTNVIAALRMARKKGITTIGFTGEAGAERLRFECDLLLVAASRDTATIQECHEFLYHHIARAVEARLTERFPSPGT